MSILPKAVCRFNAIPIIIPKTVFEKIEKPILMFTQSLKGPQRAKTALRKKNKLEHFALPDLKLLTKLI